MNKEDIQMFLREQLITKLKEADAEGLVRYAESEGFELTFQPKDFHKQLQEMKTYTNTTPIKSLQGLSNYLHNNELTKESFKISYFESDEDFPERIIIKYKEN